MLRSHSRQQILNVLVYTFVAGFQLALLGVDSFKTCSDKVQGIMELLGVPK